MNRLQDENDKVTKHSETVQKENDRFKQNRSTGPTDRPTYKSQSTTTTESDALLDDVYSQNTRLKRDNVQLTRKAEKLEGQAESYKAELQRVAKVAKKNVS